jgi:hypothetical protein
MSKIYYPYVVQEKIDEIGIQSEVSQISDDTNDIGYGQVCCNP